MKKNIVIRCAAVLFVIVMAASVLSISAFAETSCPKPYGNDTVKYYTVDYKFKKGDTLNKIYNLWGLKYETYAEDIKRINGIENLDLIYIDTVLRLPTTASNLQNDEYRTVMSHIMSRGETVSDVCSLYGLNYKDYEKRLEVYNGLTDLTKVKAGQELLIPIE